MSSLSARISSTLPPPPPSRPYISIEIFTDWEGRWLRVDDAASYRYPTPSEFPSSLFRYSLRDGVHLCPLSLALSLSTIAVLYHRFPSSIRYLRERRGGGF